MKNLVALFCLLIGYINAKSQTNKNTQDLNFLYQTIKKLPSYQDQVKTNPNLQQAITKALTIDDNANTFEVFTKLYEMILPIRDNHLAFYSHKDSLFAKPTVLDLSKTSIENARSAKKVDDHVAGTYYASKYQLELLKIDSTYVGVIENAGRYYTQFVLKEVTPNHFDMVSFNKNGQGYFIVRNIFYVNERLVGLPWRKNEKPDFCSPDAAAPTYDFKKLDDQISYLKLGSFATTTDNIALSDKFYAQLGPINGQHLIVDLRNNGGGGFKTSKKFLDLIKKFKGKVHLLVNALTVSNAEQFTIDLMDLPNVTLYGENTRGTICYGNNMDTTIDLPSKRFSFYITDMKGRKQDLPYESIGIKPDVQLDAFSKDWITQVVEKIKTN